MRQGSRNWQALDSVEDDSGTHCIDVFQRPDGSFGFEMFRRDPEDQGRWTMLGLYSAVRFKTQHEARATAVSTVPWYAVRLLAHRT